jgi:hypothetical protein
VRGAAAVCVRGEEHVNADPRSGAASEGQPRSNVASIAWARAVVLGMLAMVALTSLKISSGVTRAGLLWSPGDSHPSIGLDSGL